ncbi:MAG: LacI family DNA-binding transcriptional regulator [Candidatus Fimadaptatus sp.]|jgi:GntR family transcriptional regulator of arabinose operon
MSKIVTLNKGRQLYDILKAEILSEKYKVGDKLPSIRELAQQYGLSKNTVNTVIAMLVNDGLASVREGNGTYVGAEKRETRMIGVMLFDFTVGFKVEIDILKYIQQNLPANYYLSVMNTADRYDTFCDCLRKLIDMGAAGFLIAPPKRAPQGDELERAIEYITRRPTVMINRPIEGVDADVYSMNLSKGIEKAFEYFVTTGKSRTAIILHDSPKFVNEELEAYRRCMKRYGLDQHPEWLIDWSDDVNVLRENVMRILPQIDSIISPDTVIVGMNDLISACGKAIPQELSIVGINDTMVSRMFNPPLTSIAFPVERIGRHAINRLIKRIEGENASPRKFVNYEPEFIIRNT